MKKIEEYIMYELASSKKSLWGLLEYSQFTLKDLVRAIGDLRRKGFITVDDEGLALTKKGREKIDKSYLFFSTRICDCCLGKRILMEGKFKEILSDFRKIVEQRPKPSIAFFQGYMKEEDVVARTAFMHRCGDIFRRKVVLVGDDDLLSVALSLTGMPSRVCVLDVDERLGDFLKKINQEYGFDIEFRRYNVAEPLPNDLIGSFDVFSSEPLETMSGLKAFVGRGVGCLKKNGSGYFGLTMLEASSQKWAEIEKLLLEMSCVITDIIKDFSRYPMNYGEVNYESFVEGLDLPAGKNFGVDWYKSTLFRFEAIGEPKRIIPVNKKLKINHVDREEDLTHPWAYTQIKKQNSCRLRKNEKP